MTRTEGRHRNRAGGTGKTAIAIQLARRWRTETGGRLVFIEVEHCPAELSLPAFAAAELDVRLPVDGDVSTCWRRN